MAGAAIYLASRAGAYVSGAVMPVDAGERTNVVSAINKWTGRIHGYSDSW